MTAVKVEVTFDDIANGTPGACRDCPIALALERLLSDRVLFVVELGCLSWAGPTIGAHGSIPMPQAAADFIEGFDRGYEVEPFGFEIELPDELLAVTGAP